ncbi:MAG: tyrosine-type recombinase/integrase [Bacillota bacterium]
MAIRRNKNGTYTADVYDYKGERLRETFIKKAEAEAFVSKHETVKRNMRLVNAKLKKFRPMMDKALDEFSNTKNNLSPKSVQKYQFHIKQIRYFCDAMKIIYVDDFTPDHATRLYEELIAEKPDPKGNRDKMMKAQPKTVNAFLATLKAFFRDEVIKGHIDRSPVLHLKNLKLMKKRPDYYSEQELSKLFSQQMHPNLRAAFMGLLHTGMRIGEMESLTWNDVDFKRKLIHIRSKEGFQTKTYYSNRSIPMTETLYNLLTEMNKERQNDTYPFVSIEGHQLRERKLLSQCKEIAEKAGIKKAYLHKFRHTFATHLVQKGVRLEQIQKLLGHSSIQETLVYAHVKPEGLHPEVSVLDGLDIFDDKDNQK